MMTALAASGPLRGEIKQHGTARRSNNYHMQPSSRHYRMPTPGLMSVLPAAAVDDGAGTPAARPLESGVTPRKLPGLTGH